MWSYCFVSLSKIIHLLLVEVQSKENAKIRNQYDQTAHLTQDTMWKTDKNTTKHYIQESQEATYFPTGDHKAAWSRQDNMTDTYETQITKKIHKRSRALERLARKLLEGSNIFNGTNLTFISNVDQDK